MTLLIIKASIAYRKALVQLAKEQEWLFNRCCWNVYVNSLLNVSIFFMLFNLTFVLIRILNCVWF